MGNRWSSSDEPVGPTVVTVSRETIERISKGGIVDIPFLQISQLINDLEEHYVKMMRCIQNTHTNKWGLDVNDLKEHYDELIKMFQPRTPNAEEEEAALMNCTKNLLDCYVKIFGIDEVLFQKLLLNAEKHSTAEDTLTQKGRKVLAKQEKK